MEKTIWENKLSRHRWNCTICGEETGLEHLVGRSILCARHDTLWRRIKARFFQELR